MLYQSAHADTIVLKTGKTHEGRVISEDATSYLFEINVTSSIKDERRIPKDHVKEIIKESIESKDFKRISALVPMRDLQPAAAYTKRIEIAKSFITKFPKSKHGAAAKKILSTLEKEHQTISDGGIKLDGQLISHSDIEANAYDIHASLLLRDMERLSAARRYHEALRKWETLDSDYRNSTSFRNGIPTAKRIIQTYQISLKLLLDTLDTRIAARKSAIDSMNANDRERTEIVLAEQQKRHAILVEKEKTNLRLKWLTVDPYDKASIDHNYRQTATTLKSITSLSNTNAKELKLAGPTYRDAWAALAKGDLDGAELHLKNLRSLRLPERYITTLQTKLQEKRDAKTEADKKAKQEAAEEKLRQSKLDKEAAEKAAKEGKKGNANKKRPAKP